MNQILLPWQSVTFMFTKSTSFQKFRLMKVESFRAKVLNSSVFSLLLSFSCSCNEIRKNLIKKRERGGLNKRASFS